MWAVIINKAGYSRECVGHLMIILHWDCPSLESKAKRGKINIKQKKLSFVSMMLYGHNVCSYT